MLDGKANQVGSQQSSMEHHKLEIPSDDRAVDHAYEDNEDDQRLGEQLNATNPHSAPE